MGQSNPAADLSWVGHWGWGEQSTRVRLLPAASATVCDQPSRDRVERGAGPTDVRQLSFCRTVLVVSPLRNDDAERARPLSRAPSTRPRRLAIRSLSASLVAPSMELPLAACVSMLVVLTLCVTNVLR